MNPLAALNAVGPNGSYNWQLYGNNGSYNLKNRPIANWTVGLYWAGTGMSGQLMDQTITFELTGEGHQNAIETDKILSHFGLNWGNAHCHVDG